MPDRAAVEAFIDGYRRTFESFDVAAITARYAFPVQVVGDGGPFAGVLVVPGADAWAEQVTRIVGAYRLLGVAGAQVTRLDVTEVTPRIAHATVNWSLRTASDDPVYDFTASYTLADTEDGTRIVGIAHDESPKLAAAVAKARGA